VTPDIVRILQAITSSLHTFICIHALDESLVVHRVKLLGSLKKIHEMSCAHEYSSQEGLIFGLRLRSVLPDG